MELKNNLVQLVLTLNNCDYLLPTSLNLSNRNSAGNLDKSLLPRKSFNDLRHSTKWSDVCLNNSKQLLQYMFLNSHSL